MLKKFLGEFEPLKNEENLKIYDRKRPKTGQNIRYSLR
ncbi:MAG: hypothetical protein KatS3mg088_740 [Patescibacteria group bacterium]|nr:MAG: hypothetical protein KatS3mg088_740 [Patescibacteria group bacterium]